jgi:hypothetical protein
METTLSGFERATDFSPRFAVLVEKGGTMTYETPAVDVIGSASELIQTRIGTGPDGGPVGQNKLVLLSNLES